VIVGGESGPRARSCDLAWIENLVLQCMAAPCAVFVKQIGASPARNGVRFEAKDRKGGDPDEWPSAIKLRQLPASW